MFRHARYIDFEEIVTLPHSLTAFAMALLSSTAMAQQTSQPQDPSDANIAVPTTHYSSAFKNYQITSDEKKSPDQFWRAANIDVGKPATDMGQMHNTGTAAPLPPPKTEAHHGHDTVSTGKGN